MIAQLEAIRPNAKIARRPVGDGVFVASHGRARTRGGEFIEVYLNGIPCPTCIYASVTDGLVESYIFHQDDDEPGDEGKYIAKDGFGRPKTKIEYGKVEFRHIISSHDETRERRVIRSDYLSARRPVVPYKVAFPPLLVGFVHCPV